ncbi:MAG: hypothetical protein MK179_19000, partial [Pirellulaceae bacterium]|nr:hypothetical protein [Pirellulaceae bacterium]
MGVLLNFVNKVADEVGKKYPDVKIGALAYQYSHKPPRRQMRPGGKVEGHLSPGKGWESKGENAPG